MTKHKKAAQHVKANIFMKIMTGNIQDMEKESKININ